MKKLITLLLAIAGMVSTASATTMYILGSNSELGAWDPSAGIAMTAASDGTYYFTFTASKSETYYFCFSTALGTNKDDWNTFNGSSYRPSANNSNSYKLTFGLPLTGSNYILSGKSSDSSYYVENLTSGTSYLVGFDPTNLRLVFTYAPSNVYILGGANGWHTNSGTTMTAGDDYIYTADFVISEGATTFAFSTYLSSTENDWNGIGAYRFGDENQSSPTLNSFPISGYGMRWTSENGGTYSISTAGIYKIVLDYKMLKLSVYQTESVNTNTSGYCTYVNTNSLTISGATAYYAVDTNDGSATAKAITNPVANTPMLIKGEASTTYYFAVAASGTSLDETNAFKAGDGSTINGTADGKFNYVLNGDAFYLAKSSGTTVASGKAYLQLSKQAGAGARVLRFADDETQAINAISTGNVADGAYYNLSGQRVGAPTKGLYIQNGKKMIVK